MKNSITPVEQPVLQKVTNNLPATPEDINVEAAVPVFNFIGSAFREAIAAEAELEKCCIYMEFRNSKTGDVYAANTKIERRHDHEIEE